MFKAVAPIRFIKFKVLYTSQRAATTVAARTVTGDNVLPFSKVPKIPALPFIGNAWIYLPVIGKYKFSKLHKAALQKYYDYGPVHIDAYNSKFVSVSIYDPDDVATVFRSEGKFPDRLTLKSFKKFRDTRRDIYNNGGLLTTEGPEWWTLRKATQPHMMKPKAIHAYLGAMDKVSQDFTDRMAHIRGKDGGEIPNYLNELYKWGLESVSLVAFDTRLGGFDNNPKQEISKMINAVNNVFACLMQLEFGWSTLWLKYPSYTYNKFEKNMDYFSKQAFKFLREAKERLAQAPEDHDLTFLELMLSTTKDPRDLTAVITDMIFGGVDSTACTVGLTLYHLARHPHVQENLYQEIKSNVKGGPLTAETMNELTYLKACVKESMRITPVAIGNGRRLVEDTVLGGYAIPAGMQIIIQGYAIGQIDKFFPEPQKFKPERFLRDEAIHHPFAFLPFGFGPRMCIGQRIAQQEIWTLLTRIIQRYRVEYHYEDIDVDLRGVGIPDKPLRFQFYDRKS